MYHIINNLSKHMEIISITPEFSEKIRVKTKKNCNIRKNRSRSKSHTHRKIPANFVSGRVCTSGKTRLSKRKSNSSFEVTFKGHFR